MDALEKYVSEANVRRFRDQLTEEPDAVRRSILLRLLVAEEDRLGYDREQLDNVEREIQRCRAFVTSQRARVDDLRSKGSDIVHAHALLETLQESLGAHERHRDRIRLALAGAQL